MKALYRAQFSSQRKCPWRRGILFACICSLTACESMQWLPSSVRKTSSQMTQTTKPHSAHEVEPYVTALQEAEAKQQDLLNQAQQAMHAEDWSHAEDLFHGLLILQPNHPLALQSLESIALRKQYVELLAQVDRHLSQTGSGDRQYAEHVAQAGKLLRQILTQHPKHPEALMRYQQLQSIQMHAQQRTQKKFSYDKPLNMDFRDVNLKMIFETLSRITGVNFILDKDIASEIKATLFVKNMLFNDAFDLLLRTNQLDKKILSDNTAIIFTNDITHQREYKDLSVRSFTLDYADAKQLSGLLRNMLNMRSIEIDARLNTLMIKDTAEMLALAEKIIMAQDKPDPEVMLDVQILELQRSRSQDLGVSPPTGLSVIASGNGLTLNDLKTIDSEGIGVRAGENGVGLSFGAGIIDVNLLANPRIRVKNKESAKIHIGEKVPVITSNVSANGVQSQSVQYIDAGLKLDVEPIISFGNDVTIKLSLNVGSIGSSYTVATGSAPRVGTRFTGTTLRLHDGETQVLAGLIDDQDRKNMSGIAGLLNIPILGRMFSVKSTSNTKTEIVLSITPHIVRPRAVPMVHEADIWVGPEQAGGQATSAPMFGNGQVPFSVPKPPTPPAAPAAAKNEGPENLNIPLPPGFSLGDGGLMNTVPAMDKGVR